MLPDALLAVLAALRATPAIVGSTGPRIYALTTPAQPSYPLVLVTTIVDAPLIDETDDLAQSRIQVEAIGPDVQAWVDTRALAARCHAALVDLPGGAYETVSVSGVSTIVGLQPVPDPDTGYARWMFDVRITCRRRTAA